MAHPVPQVPLNDGNTMPQLGLGVWKANDAEAREAVREALSLGYRSIDTAVMYRNEAGVGAGIRDAGLARRELFVTTKVWNSEQGSTACRKSLETSLSRLGLDYVDLLLIHWPAPKQDKYLETWQTLIALKAEGLTRSIGVANFNPPHLQRLIRETGVPPVLNQIELHPYFQQTSLHRVNTDLGLRTESWSPLAKGRALDDEVILDIAAKHGKTPAQVVVRWHLDRGLIVIPKSITPSRIRSNAEVFDFQLDAQDLAAISQLDRGLRLGPDPEALD